MAPRIGFQFGVVFPPEELLSEWAGTLATAFNDLSLVHVRMDEDFETPHKFLYWLRLAMGHYHEAGKYLSDSSEVEPVRDFVASLSDEARTLYDSCLASYRSESEALRRLRSQAAFHYPRLQPNRRQRPMAVVLQELAPEVGQIDKGTSGTVRESRLLFADDITSRFFLTASGGEERLLDVHGVIKEGITSFMRFTNIALEEWFLRRERDGARFVGMPDAPLTWQPQDDSDEAEEKPTG